jgi:hypothetical protein
MSTSALNAASGAEELPKLTSTEFKEYNKLAVLMNSYVCAKLSHDSMY